MSRDEEPGRDPHLQAALRHAPDGQVSVPPLLRARIVAAAQRSAEASRQQRPWWRRLDAGWNPWRMGGAGTAAAAVLAATVLWVGRDEQPVAPDPRPMPSAQITDRTESATRPSAAPPESTASPTSGARTAPAAPRGVDLERDNPLAFRSSPPAQPPATTQPVPDRKLEAAREASTARRTGGANDAVTPAATAAAAANRAAGRAAERATEPAREGPADGAAAQATEQRAAAATRRLAPPPTGSPAIAAAAPAPAPAAERPAPFVDAAPQTAARDGASPRAAAHAVQAEAAAPPRPEQRSDSSVMRMRQGAAAGATAGPAPAPSPAGAVTSAAPATAPAAASAMPAVRAPAAQGATAPPGPARDSAIGGSAMLSASQQSLVETWLAAAGPTSWRRRAPSGEEATLAARWWPELVAATRGRWTSAPMGTSDSTFAVAAGEAWTLVRPDGRQVSLTWLAGAVVVCDLQAARCERARLEEASLEALRQGLRR
jgi:hypothetical protein